MELPTDDIIKKGHLKFKGKIGMWQRQWVLLKKSSSVGGLRMERFADEKSSNKKNDNTIFLKDIDYIQCLPCDSKKYCIAIGFKGTDKKNYTVCCESEAERRSWNSVLNEWCLNPTREIAQGLSSIDLLQSGPSQKELTEVFNVYLLPSLNLAFYGESLLQVTQEYLHILDANYPERKLATWPLNTLRRYGNDDNTFSFESGRFCDTGEGIFIIKTKDGADIYKKVHAAAVAIAEMHRHLHMQNLSRGVSAPAPSSHNEIPLAVRSISSPDTNKSGAVLRGPRQRDGPNSALDSPLPPIPHQFHQQYLTAEYYDDIKNYDDIPNEDAPSPPHSSSNYMEMDRNTDESGEYLLVLGKSQRRFNRDTDYELPIYEESSLTPAFRHFLKERKKDEK